MNYWTREYEQYLKGVKQQLNKMKNFASPEEATELANEIQRHLNSVVEDICAEGRAEDSIFNQPQ